VDQSVADRLSGRDTGRFGVMGEAAHPREIGVVLGE
jgi:hypothetical protein